jgi:hypothetical protein
MLIVAAVALGTSQGAQPLRDIREVAADLVVPQMTTAGPEPGKRVRQQWGRDPDRLALYGFSRGAIACNYIGLRNDEIAKLWKCMIVHSHYDGVRRWPYADRDRNSALVRLRRLNGRPQFITHEVSLDDTRKFLQDSQIGQIEQSLTLVALPFPNHTDGWVLRPLAEHDQLRK